MLCLVCVAYFVAFIKGEIIEKQFLGFLLFILSVLQLKSCSGLCFVLVTGYLSPPLLWNVVFGGVAVVAMVSVSRVREGMAGLFAVEVWRSA